MDEIIDGLWVGDIQDVQQRDTSRFDAIVTVCQDSVADNVGQCTYSHYKLADGEPEGFNPGECSYDLFEEAVEEVIGHVQADNETLVHCHAGRNRSAMVVTAAITELKDETPNEAVGRIHDVRHVHPTQEMPTFANRFWKEQNALTWRCTDCGDVFESTPSRHDPDYCECGEAMVDHEDVYVRRNASVESVERDETAV